jgi:hypothetical protein
MLTRPLSLATVVAGLAAPALAEIELRDSYARAAMPGAPSGAAFMEIVNTGPEDDRLVAAGADIAARVELHTHREDSEGVMRMVHVEEGFAIPAGETLRLERGGRHVMFMGLTETLTQGETVTVTLTFEKAGDMVVEIPVDLERMPGE